MFTLYIKEYQIIKKYYKNIKSEIIYLGFPQNAFEQILQIPINKTIQKTEKQIVISEYAINSDKYISWKADIKLWQSSGTLPKLVNANITETIKNFSVANKTPIECQQFLNELQNKLNGNI